MSVPLACAICNSEGPVKLLEWSGPRSADDMTPVTLVSALCDDCEGAFWAHVLAEIRRGTTMSDDYNPEARPDDLDRLCAYTAGWRHGQSIGEVDRDKAAVELRKLGRDVATSKDDRALFFAVGSAAGASGDKILYVAALAFSNMGKR